MSSGFMKPLYRLLRLATAPVRTDTGRGGLVVHPFRGYGSRSEAFLIGRVMRQPRLHWLRRWSAGGNSPNLLRRLLRRGQGGACVRSRFGGATATAVTDRDGYFRLHFHHAAASADDGAWHPIDVTLEEPAEAAGGSATGFVYVCPPKSRFVVISDIDDTVVHTGVANKLKMFWHLFFRDADNRVAYPGVAALYRQFHKGVTGADGNPMLYVSRGPWSIYEVLDEFFRIHDIPVGPILFLREWGLTLQRPLPPPAKDHKLNLIRHMLALYDDLPFVLIGDSGQRDPEIYARVVRENPERVRAIYIRNVGQDAARDAAIAALADEVAAAGSTLALAADTAAMADHAAEHGLVDANTPALVRGERAADGAPAARGQTRRVTAAAGKPGASEVVEEALDSDNKDGKDGSVVVDTGAATSQSRRGRRRGAIGGHGGSSA